MNSWGYAGDPGGARIPGTGHAGLFCCNIRTREPERAPWGPRAGEEPEASPSPAPGEGRKDVEEMVREPEAQGLSKEDIAYQLMQ